MPESPEVQQMAADEEVKCSENNITETSEPSLGQGLDT